MLANVAGVVIGTLIVALGFYLTIFSKHALSSFHRNFRDTFGREGFVGVSRALPIAVGVGSLALGVLMIVIGLRGGFG